MRLISWMVQRRSNPLAIGVAARCALRIDNDWGDARPPTGSDE